MTAPDSSKACNHKLNGSPLRWTTKSTRALADELTRAGHKVSADTVGDLLREQGFSLQGNAKTIEGNQHPDRDAQFRYLNDQATAYRAAGDPVISVDTKKKELVGQYKNAGRQWRPTGEPVQVQTHDFPDRDLGKAIPYGIYDLGANTGWVGVGTDHAAFLPREKGEVGMGVLHALKRELDPENIMNPGKLL